MQEGEPLFEFLESVGEGAYAVVWKCRLCSDPSKIFALKAIKNAPASDSKVPAAASTSHCLGIPRDAFREIKVN